MIIFIPSAQQRDFVVDFLVLGVETVDKIEMLLNVPTLSRGEVCNPVSYSIVIIPYIDCPLFPFFVTIFWASELLFNRE